MMRFRTRLDPTDSRPSFFLYDATILAAAWPSAVVFLGRFLSRRRAVVAFTPAIVVKTMLGLAEVRPPFAWLVFFAISMAYLYFGMKATAETRLEMTRPQRQVA